MDDSLYEKTFDSDDIERVLGVEAFLWNALNGERGDIAMNAVCIVLCKMQYWYRMEDAEFFARLHAQVSEIKRIVAEGSNDDDEVA